MAKSKTHNLNPSNKRSSEEWAKRFDELLLRERKIVFEIGDALVAAQEELTKTEFLDAIKKSGLKSKTNALNYIRVARAEHLRKPEVQKQLPAGVGTLIDLAAWSPKEIEVAIAKKVIHPQSQRKPLQKWIDDKRSVAKKPEAIDYTNRVDAPDAVVVGYIMASLDEFNREDAKRVEEAIRRLQQEFPSFNFFVTASKEANSITFHRLEDLANRIIKEYQSSPELFVDPDFKKMMEFRTGGNIHYLIHHIRKLAYLLASADHGQLHKRLKFTKAEWRFLGVENPGHLTVMPFMQEPARSSTNKTNRTKKK